MNYKTYFFRENIIEYSMRKKGGFLYGKNR